jgi:uncharacterized protein YuzE
MNAGNRVFDHEPADESAVSADGSVLKHAPTARFSGLTSAEPDASASGSTQMWLDYDEEADVLYIHFEKKPSSTHSELRDDGVILDYRGSRLVGITVLEASQRISAKSLVRK